MSHGDQVGPHTAETSHSTLRSAAEPDYAGTFGASQPPGSPSNNQGTSSLITSSSTNAASEDEWLCVLSKLEESIGAFRKGEVSKTDTLSTILRVLNENVNVMLTQSQKEATFNSYLTEI